MLNARSHDRNAHLALLKATRRSISLGGLPPASTRDASRSDALLDGAHASTRALGLIRSSYGETAAQKGRGGGAGQSVDCDRCHLATQAVYWCQRGDMSQQK